MSLCKVLAVRDLATSAAKRSHVEAESDDQQMEIKFSILTMLIPKQALTKMFTKLGGFFGAAMDFSNSVRSDSIDFSQSEDLTPAFMQQLVTAYKEEKNEFDFDGFFTNVKDACEKWKSINFLQSDLLIHARNHYLCMTTDIGNFEAAEKNPIYQELATWATDKLINLLCLQDKKVRPSSLDEDPICLYKLHHSPITWKLYKTLEEHTSSVTSVAIHPNGTEIVSGSLENTLKVWNLETGRVLKTLRSTTPLDGVSVEGVGVIAMGSNGNLLVTKEFDDDEEDDYNTVIEVWDMKTYTLVKSFNNIWDLNSIAISPDEKHFIICQENDGITLWDIHTGQCLKTLKEGKKFTISPDWKYLVCGGNKSLQVLEMGTYVLLKTLEEHNDVSSIAISPDGKYIISGSMDGYIRVSDIDTGQYLKTLKGYRSIVVSVAISPDGKYIISTGIDLKYYQTIKVWDITEGQLLPTLEGHSRDIYSVAISPDGKYIVSGSEDKSIKIWRAELAHPSV